MHQRNYVASRMALWKFIIIIIIIIIIIRNNDMSFWNASEVERISLQLVMHFKRQ